MRGEVGGECKWLYNESEISELITYGSDKDVSKIYKVLY